MLGRGRPQLGRARKIWQEVDIPDKTTEGIFKNVEQVSIIENLFMKIGWWNVIKGKMKVMKGSEGSGKRIKQKFEEFRLGEWVRVGFPSGTHAWQDFTFLDGGLRISWTNLGHVFVNRRER